MLVKIPPAARDWDNRAPMPTLNPISPDRWKLSVAPMMDCHDV